MLNGASLLGGSFEASARLPLLICPLRDASVQVTTCNASERGLPLACPDAWNWQVSHPLSWRTRLVPCPPAPSCTFGGLQVDASFLPFLSAHMRGGPFTGLAALRALRICRALCVCLAVCCTLQASAAASSGSCWPAGVPASRAHRRPPVETGRSAGTSAPGTTLLSGLAQWPRRSAAARAPRR